jgi:hypothetical protein
MSTPISSTTPSVCDPNLASCESASKLLWVSRNLPASYETGLASAFHASINCGKELRAVSDCRDEAEVRRSNAELVVADCHDRGGAVSPGASSNEIICEVTP